MAQTIALKEIISCSVFHFHEDGLIFRFHELSHTKAMHLVQANVNPVYIKDCLGHADISTTEIYARADNEAKRAALEKASEHLGLPSVSDWEQDSELIDWLSSLE